MNRVTTALAGVPKALPFLLAFFVALSCGCARERVSVTVGTNGMWTRKNVYSVSVLDIGEAGKSPEVSEAFALPSGPGWKLTSQATKEEKRVIAERTVPLEQTIEDDIIVKETPKLAAPNADPNKKPAPQLVTSDDSPKAPRLLTSNTAGVRQVSPGRFEYSETIHWKGDVPETMHKFDEKEATLVRAALPVALATDENVKAVANIFSKEFALALIGPPTPLLHRLPMMMSAPEMFARAISKRMAGRVITALKDKFGDRLTAAQRVAITARMVQGIADEMRTSGPSQAGDPQNAGGNNNGAGATLFISVRLPGRVVETNGISDPYSGDVTWSFFPEAAAFGDIVLTATSDAAPVAR